MWMRIRKITSAMTWIALYLMEDSGYNFYKGCGIGGSKRLEMDDRHTLRRKRLYEKIFMAVYPGKRAVPDRMRLYIFGGRKGGIAGESGRK